MTADRAQFAKLEKQFVQDFGQSMQGVGLDTWARIQAGEDAYSALVASMEARRAFAGIDSAVLSYAREALRQGWPGGITSSNPEANKWLLKTSYAGTKRPLIKTLKSKTYMSGVKGLLTSQMQQGYNWQRAAQAVVKAGVQRDPGLPKYMEKAVDAARKATKSPAKAKEYERELKSAQAKVDQLAKNGAPTTALKAAYQNVLDKTESGTADALQAAVDRAVYNKIKYEAQRIARTEGFAAYGQSRVEEAIDDPDVSALRFELSTRHHDFDQCDIIANSNLYGLGAGIYPTDKAPRLPIHPNGMSYFSKVSVRKISQDKANGAEFDKQKWDSEAARRGLSPSQSNPPQVTKPLIPSEVRA